MNNPMNNDYAIISSTFADREAAIKTARVLVERRLAACVQLFPIESIYIWQGEVCEDGEVAMLIKSKAELFDKIAAAIKENHPYEVPQIIQVPIVNGLPAYLEWIGDSVS